MNFYHGKLKVLAVVGGIALALVPCFQQTHAVCQLVGCMERVLVAPVEADGSQEVNRNRCCSSPSKAPCETPQQHRNGDVPCGPYCSCSQAPTPSEAPRNSTECAKSSISILHFAGSLTAGAKGLFAFEDFASFSSESLPSLSAGDTCRILCRYLT